MKFEFLKYVPFALVGGILPAAEVTILEEDFEGDPGTEIFVSGNVNLTATEIVDDPQAGGTRGKVLQVDLSGNGQWCGLAHVSPATPLIPLLPLGITPGTDDYVWTADIYVPSTTFLANNDSTGLRIRWTDEAQSGKTEPANQLNMDNGFWGRDQWVTITLQGDIPDTFGTNGAATTHVNPIISLRDTDFEALGEGAEAVFSTALYIDNIKMIANTSGEDPNFVGNGNSQFGIVGPGADVTGTYTVANSGLTNDLVLSSGTLAGAAADQYTLVTTFPVTIPPGQSADIEVIFDSSNEAGVYSASLDLATNDTSDPTFTLDLSCIIYEAGGEEMIINGGFETGNTLGFGSAQTFEAVEATPELPAHTGNYYAAYTLSGGNQWGSATLNQPSPPNVDGEPTQIAITPEMIGNPYLFKVWYNRPAENGIGDEDTVTMIVRWNGITPDSGPFGSYSGADLGSGEWIEFIEEGIIPATWPVDNPDTPEDESGDPVTSAYLIFSVRDVDPALNPDGGQRIFMDDFSFTVDVPVVELPVYPIIEVFTRSNADGSSSLTWTSKPDQTYRIELSNDLENWLEIEEEYPAEGNEATTTSWTDSTSNGVDKRFYRVILNQPPAAE